VLITGGTDSNSRRLRSAELYETNGPATRPRNISSRLRVETDDNVAIAGFIITGSAQKRVIIRAIGPSLTASGVAGALVDPVLQLHKPGGTVLLNDNWRENEAEVLATNLAPGRDEESAIVATLPPGAYTAMMRGQAGGTGVGLVEVYELDTSATSSLGNISTRGQVQTGENVMIGGFILGGSQNVTQVVVRGIGPSLSAAGLAEVVADPVIDLRDANGERLIANDDWQSERDVAAQLVAHRLAPNRPEEAAIFTILPPGNYTVILTGKGSRGIGLVEVYNVR
jgi:hypothetical protein